MSFPKEERTLQIIEEKESPGQRYIPAQCHHRWKRGGPWKSVIKTLPEAQRTQDIETKTWIISKTWNKCKFQFSTLAFLHSLVTTFPTLCTFLSSYSPTTISMTTVTSQWSNNIYCRQHDYSSRAHQLQYSVQLLYHHLADPHRLTLGSTTI